MAKAKNNTQKKASTAAAKTSKQVRKKSKMNLKEYFKGVKLEMKKVVWPTKKELGSYTIVVLVTCGFFALGFWLVDTGFLALLRRVFGITMGS